MAQQASEQLLADMKKFLKADQFSDLNITCGEDAYKVHKVVVCTRSEFFAGAVRFNAGKEGHEGNVDLTEDDPAIVKLLVEYLYEAEYNPRLTGDPTQPDMPKAHTCNTSDKTPGDRNKLCRSQICCHHTCSLQCRSTCKDFFCDVCPPNEAILARLAEHLLTHAKMYEIGDKYQVSGLKHLSKRKFELACEKFWDDDRFPEAANYALSTTSDEDEGLRNIVISTISRNMRLLKKPAVEALITDFGGLAFRLLKEKAEYYESFG